jgi:hypothetical protein
VVAVVISMVQELNWATSSTVEQPAAPVAEIPQNGTKVEGLVILSTDSFRKQFKDLLIEKEYNLDVKEFPFEGNEYWLNMFLTHGHMIVVFFLVSRYQAEQEQGRKTKIMMLGMLLVFGWMFLTPHLKTQRLGLEFRGQKIYQHDHFDANEIFAKIEEYDEVDTFGLEPPVVPSQPNSDIKYATEQEFAEETVIHEDF